MKLAQSRRVRPRHSRRQRQRQGDFPGRRIDQGAQSALHFRHRLWLVRPAGRISRPPRAAKALPARNPGEDDRHRAARARRLSAPSRKGSDRYPPTEAAHVQQRDCSNFIQTLRRHRRPVSGAQLAAELAVSLRTIYRDIHTLIAQGTPIDRKSRIGYVLRPGFPSPPLMFPTSRSRRSPRFRIGGARLAILPWLRAARNTLAESRPCCRSSQPTRRGVTVVAAAIKSGRHRPRRSGANSKCNPD